MCHHPRVSRRPRLSPTTPLAVALALLAIGGGPARAQSGETCAAAYETAQELRLGGELVSAQRELDVCVAACPAALARDCADWQRDVAARIGRVRIDVTVEGIPGAPSAVWVDGVAAVPGPDGAIALDPGAHEVRVHVDTAPPATRAVTVAPGGIVALRFDLTRDAADAAPRPWAPPTASIALGAIGAGALLVGGGLAIAGHVRVADLRDGCAPECAPSDVDAVRAMWIAGGVAAGAGVAAIVVATVLALGDDGATSGSTARRPRALVLAAPPAGAPLGLGARARF